MSTASMGSTQARYALDEALVHPFEWTAETGSEERVDDKVAGRRSTEGGLDRFVTDHA